MGFPGLVTVPFEVTPPEGKGANPRKGESGRRPNLKVARETSVRRRGSHPVWGATWHPSLTTLPSILGVHSWVMWQLCVSRGREGPWLCVLASTCCSRASGLWGQWRLRVHLAGMSRGRATRCLPIPLRESAPVDGDYFPFCGVLSTFITGDFEAQKILIWMISTEVIFFSLHMLLGSHPGDRPQIQGHKDLLLHFLLRAS